MGSSIEEDVLDILRLWGLPGEWIWPLHKGHVVWFKHPAGFTLAEAVTRCSRALMLWSPRCLGGFIWEEEDFVKFCSVA